MRAARRWLPAVAVLVAGTDARAQTPARLADIPLYAGAQRDPDGCWDETCRRLIASAPIEQVFHFYQRRLAARPGLGKGDEVSHPLDSALAQLGPVDVTPVLFRAETYLWRLDAAAEEWGAAVKKRPPYRPGEWLSGAELAWGRREATRELLFSVSLEDKWEVQENGWRFTTAIHLYVSERESRTVVAEREQQEEEAEQRAEAERQRAEREAERGAKEDADRRAAARLADLRRGPSQQELGAAPYPGAVLQVDLSASQSSDDERKYFFLTADPVARVVAFYEQRTGKKAQGFPDGSYVLVLRGVMPEPEAALSVFPNRIVPGKAPTAIGFYRRVQGRAAEREAVDETQPVEPAATPPVGAPSQRDLGVPLYPGAEFDAPNTAGMSSEEEAYYLYRSTDPVEKVLAFYQQRTGKKAEPLDDGYLIVLRGEAPFPDLGVTIQANTMFPPPARTIITIRKSLQ